MAISKDKLVQSKVLQDFLVDKVTGEALTAGIITLYKDNSRTELKNWFYQSGQYPNYTYKALPNPMTLSAAGTIVDESGNDVLPMYYPWSEAEDSETEFYYITVINSDGQLQFTRSRFPWSPANEAPPTNEISTLKNLIVNNRFWMALGDSNTQGWLTNTLTNSEEQVVAPSQHDGFSSPDIKFAKDAIGATDVCTFKKFIPGASPFSNSVRPEYYLNHTCGTTGTNENNKYYIIPVSLHIATLDSVSASFSIWLKSNSSTASNTLNPKIFQFTGSSSANSPSITLDLFPGGILPTTEWKQYTTTFTFPSTTGKNYDSDEVQDSAFYLELHLVPKEPIDIDIALPAIYLGNEIPTNDFNTYDEIDSIINSPRTGDTRFSINSFGLAIPSGWVPAADGTIGSSVSGATQRANPDTWPLFNLIWSSTTNTDCPLQNSSGMTILRGTSALDDFVNNNRLSIPKGVGRVIANSISFTDIGATDGSATHTLTEAELPQHTHTFDSSVGNFLVTAPGTGLITGGGFDVTDSSVSGTTGGGPGTDTPFSIIQPTVYLNLFFKL